MTSSISSFPAITVCSVLIISRTLYSRHARDTPAMTLDWALDANEVWPNDYHSGSAGYPCCHAGAGSSSWYKVPWVEVALGSGWRTEETRVLPPRRLLEGPSGWVTALHNGGETDVCPHFLRAIIKGRSSQCVPFRDECCHRPSTSKARPVCRRCIGKSWNFNGTSVNIETSVKPNPAVTGAYCHKQCANSGRAILMS